MALNVSVIVIPSSLGCENGFDVASTTKAISKAFSVLYVYDYFLTVGDEVCLATFPVDPVSERATGSVCVEGAEIVVSVALLRPKAHWTNASHSVLDVHPRETRAA